jgi:hypothetical protein
MINGDDFREYLTHSYVRDLYALVRSYSLRGCKLRLSLYWINKAYLGLKYTDWHSKSLIAY